MGLRGDSQGDTSESPGFSRGEDVRAYDPTPLRVAARALGLVPWWKAESGGLEDAFPPVNGAGSGAALVVPLEVSRAS